MGTISVKNLIVNGYLGVFDFEKEEGQPFIVNIDLNTDFGPAIDSDSLEDTIDYGMVCDLVADFFSVSHFDLLEKACFELGKSILLTDSRITSLWLEISKPEAPLDYNFSETACSIELGWNKCLLALGSNMGDKEAYLNFAIEQLNNNDAIRVLKVSNFIVTKPYGGVEQEDFLNGAVLIETILSPRQLLVAVNDIEAKAKRVREIHWGPRTLDIDIILYEDIVMSDDDLIIPHIDMLNRDFVLKPAKEVAPFMVHPLLNKRITDLI